MKSLFEELKNFNLERKSPNSERACVIKEFVEEINRERVGTKFNPITGRVVAIKLGHIKDIQHLYRFLSQARDYKNRQKSFSKYFFGALKTK